jgi:hypothetical protein
VTFVSVGGRRSSPTGCSEKDARRYWSEKDRRWYANWLRVGASPEVAYALSRAWHETDREVRHSPPDPGVQAPGAHPVGAVWVILPSGVFEDEVPDEFHHFVSYASSAVT